MLKVNCVKFVGQYPDADHFENSDLGPDLDIIGPVLYIHRKDLKISF
jgi:hypothetical protein